MPNRDVILLVNDIPDHAVVYGRALAAHGFQVQLARSGSNALQLARHTKPDCAVIDLRLPDMSGWQLCSRLRDSAGDRNMRIVVLTPELSPMRATDSAARGCDAWLAHPAAAADLVRTVTRVLDFKTTAPDSPADAVLDRKVCGACASERVRPTLRVGAIQYYCCQACAFCWRVELLVPAPSGHA